MSDASLHYRRQPPSPLVFSPDAILSPSPLQVQQSVAGISHASTSNTVSMPFVRRHVTRRLKAAKADCDKELQRITNNITAFFEERLREGDFESERVENGTTTLKQVTLTTSEIRSTTHPQSLELSRTTSTAQMVVMILSQSTAGIVVNVRTHQKQNLGLRLS